MAKIASKHAKKTPEETVDFKTNERILEDLEDRVDDLEELLGSFREEFETYKRQLYDAGIRPSTHAVAEEERQG